MRRFITYIYEYEQGNRGRNTGFIRTDLRENSCRMELQIRGVDRFKGKCPVYLTSGTDPDHCLWQRKVSDRMPFFRSGSGGTPGRIFNLSEKRSGTACRSGTDRAGHTDAIYNRTRAIPSAASHARTGTRPTVTSHARTGTHPAARNYSSTGNDPTAENNITISC